MKTKYTLLFTALMVFSLTAQAKLGGDKGHGGSGVACFGNIENAEKVKAQLSANRKTGESVDPYTDEILADLAPGSIQLLDLYNARKPSITGEIDPIIDSELPFTEIVKERTEAIRATNHILWNILNKEATSVLPMNNQAWKDSHSGVIELDDAALASILPKNCVLVQIAHQQILSPSIAVVNYDSRLFSKMSSADQAALVFHERIYNYFVINKNAEDSTTTQNIVGFLFLKRFSPKISEEAHTFFSRIGIYSSSVISNEKNELYVVESDGNYHPIYRALNDYSNSFHQRVSGEITSNIGTYSYKNPIAVDGISLITYEIKPENQYPHHGYSNAVLPGFHNKPGVSVSFDPNTGRFSEATFYLSEDSVINGWVIPKDTYEIKINSEYEVVSVRNAYDAKAEIVDTKSELKCRNITFRKNKNSGSHELSTCYSPYGKYKEVVFAGWLLLDEGNKHIINSDTQYVLPSGNFYGFNISNITSNQDQAVESFSVRDGYDGVKIDNIICSGLVKLHANSKLASCTSAGIKSNYQHRIHSPQMVQGVSVMINSIVEFHSNGKLKTAFYTGEKLKLQGKKIRNGDQLSFDASGKLISVTKPITK